MAALVFWLSYLLLAFVIAPAIFRARFGRWPFANRLGRPDAYLVIDCAYGGVTIAFTVCLFVAVIRGSSVDGLGAVHIAGLVLGVSAVALMVWAMISLGASWRIGQDRADAGVSKVTSGSYRLMQHPIYTALILLSIAMILIAGKNSCTVTFAVVTVTYAFVQGWNENRRWR